jgi:hypothetical protein
MRKLVFFSILLVLVILFYVPYLYRVASLTIEPYVPSGDDVAAHVYYTLLAYHKPNYVIPRIVNNDVISPGEYPNLIHYVFSLACLFSLKPLEVAKIYGLFSFLILCFGVLLYMRVLQLTLGSLHLSLMSCIFFTLLSPRVIQTLGDGSIMELFVVFILIPLAIFCLIRGKVFLAGVIMGLSSLNYLGMVEAALVLFPFIILKVRNPRSWLNLILGIIVGGNVFLFNAINNTLIRALLALYIPEISPSIPLTGSTLLKFSRYGEYMFLSNRNSWILYTCLLLSSLGIMLYIALNYRRGIVKRTINYERCGACLAYILSWVMLLAFTLFPLLSRLSIGFEIQTRILRIASMMSTLPIVASSSLLEEFLQTFFPKVKMVIKVCEKRIISLREKSLIVLICLALLLSLLLATSPNLYRVLLSKPGGLIRLDEESYTSLMHFKNTFLQHETNVNITAATQVASWALPILTDFDNNIRVILMSTITNTSGLPRWALTTVEIYNGIMHLNATILKKYNIKYIVAMLPRENQWYDPRSKDFALKLWKTDFSSIADLIYEKTDNCTSCIKIWRLND